MRRTGSGRDTVGITSWICQRRRALLASSSSLGASEPGWATSTRCQWACSSVSLKEFGQVFTHTSSLLPGAQWARVSFWGCHVNHSPMDKAVRESAYVFEYITGWPMDPRTCLANDGPRETTRNRATQQISHPDLSKINSGWVCDVHAIDRVGSTRIRLTVCCPD